MILEGLNENQRLAVITTEGPILVLAGPGSGKTRVLTQRIAYLIDECGIIPSQIMAVTFTNKAAAEMRERAKRLVQRSMQGIMLGTFHAICARMLRESADYIPYDHKFTIYDTEDQRTVMKNILQNMRVDIKTHTPASVLGRISKAKNELITPEQYVPLEYKDKIVKKAYHQYQADLLKNNALDFDDLLMQTVLLLQDHPAVLHRYQDQFQYLMIDEFQDTNIAQYELVKLLAQGNQNVFVVGDPDQSIYAFRGADYRNVRRFRADFPKHTLIALNENYRSHQLILDAAMAIIRQDPNHIKRDLFSQRRSGAQIQVHELLTGQDEADFVVSKLRRLHTAEGYALREMAVMYRTNAQTRQLEKALRLAGLPYHIVSGLRFYERREIKDALAYLHVINNPEDHLRFKRILNIPARSIGAKTQQVLADWIEQRGEGQWAVLLDIANGAEGNLGRGAGAVRQFVQMLMGWYALASGDTVDLVLLLDTILEQIDYDTHLEKISKDNNEAQSRRENIDELRRELREYAGYSLSEYLEQTSLLSEFDKADPEKEAVLLMTLHGAKGLEFPVVFIVGVEDGYLPHFMSMGDIEQLAEERRLMYVGITRAKDHLYLTFANERYSVRGGSHDIEYRRPSDFLGDLPTETTQLHTLPRATAKRPTSNHTRWDVPASRAQSARFKAGDVVHHAKFGAGIVQSAEVTNYGEEQVTVQFENAGIKVLIADFLQKR